MNSKQRIVSALERKEPDRIPIMELSIHPNTIFSICRNGSYFDFVEQADLDAVVISQVSDPGSIKWIDKEKGIFQDHWGVIKRFTGEDTPYPLKGPIKSERDLRSYTPPDPHDESILSDLPSIIERFKNRKAIMCIGPTIFANSFYLRGMENLLMDYILRPHLAKNLAQMSMEYYLEFHKRLIRAGVDVIVLGDDYAYKTGPLMSPSQFKEFVYPYLKKIVANIHKQGAYCIKHTDGNIWQIIDMIVDTDIDGIGPLEPAAGMDLGKVKKKYGHRVCVIGNIDLGLLSRATIDEVIEETKRCIMRVSPGGGHILSSGNSISSSVKPENFIAMIKTAKIYGKYPIHEGE